MGILYFVSTPIGNLEDITLRALRTLREVDIIAAEDTRVTRALLSHYDIHTKLISHHNANEKLMVEKMLEILANQDVAVVSDAGTPLINDPGFPLLNAALEAGYTVVPIPGASSPITALSVSGLPVDEFTYLGYLPHKQGERLTYLKQKSEMTSTLLLFSTPHRLLDDLDAMLTVWGNRRIAVCREMTKKFEEILRTDLQGALDHFHTNPPLGEFVLVVHGTEISTRWDQNTVESTIAQGIKEGTKSSDLASEIAQKSGWSKKEIYRLIESRKTRKQNESG